LTLALEFRHGLAQGLTCTTSERSAVTASANVAHERFFIQGRVDSDKFPPWIERHARKLGVACHIDRQDRATLEAVLTGPVELLDAMEMACLLGPFQVWVDQIERRPLNSLPEQ